MIKEIEGQVATVKESGEWIARYKAIIIDALDAKIAYQSSAKESEETLRDKAKLKRIAVADFEARVLAFRHLLYLMNKRHLFSCIAFGDETFVLRRPVPKLTVEVRGTKHVRVSSFESKEGLTVWLCAYVTREFRNGAFSTTSMTMLPPHFIMEKKFSNPSTKYEAIKDFPAPCTAAHTNSGWMNHVSMSAWVTEHLPDLRQGNNLPGLMIFDLHASHRHEDTIKALKDKNWLVLFIPGCCTGAVQIMDTHVNRGFKSQCQHLFDETAHKKIGDTGDEAAKGKKQTNKILSERIGKAWSMQREAIMKGVATHIDPYCVFKREPVTEEQAQQMEAIPSREELEKKEAAQFEEANQQGIIDARYRNTTLMMTTGRLIRLTSRIW